MFSQFKNAVEHLAQQVPVPQIPGVDEHLPRRGSTEIQGTRSTSPLSSGQLAETALTSLRKSLSSHRSVTPDSHARTTSSTGTPPRKSNLEERLRRATFAIGDASNSSTNPPSKKASPSPSPAPSSVKQRRSQSPASIPIPQSPELQPLDTTEANQKADDAPGEFELGNLNTAEATQPPKSQAENSEDAAVDTIEAGQPLEPRLEDSEKAVAEQQKESAPNVIPEQQKEPKEESTQDSSSSGSRVVENAAPEEQPEAKDTASPEPQVAEEGSVAITKKRTVVKGPGVEELQQRLKEVEQRFADVSTSFKRLQAEKRAADSVLRELTPLETIQDNEGFSDYLKNVKSKISVSQDEIRRLNSKLEDYEGQLEDLRKVHLSETKSHSEEIEKLRVQLKETEALFQASEQAVSQVEGKIASHESQTDELHAQIEKLRSRAKEEEEKRVKAISLLKTVRQKLVKTEKERDEALQQASASKDLDKDERERERVERLRLQHDLEALQIEKEKTVAAQKAQFDREMTLLKERYERELSAVKGQLELDIITLKSSQSKDIASKNAQISTLENSLNNVARDKNTFFEQLQIKQAETESAQGHLESVQLQNTELEFQLREANDRLSLLREEYAEYQQEQDSRTREPATSANDIAQMVSATESRYEMKLNEMKRSLEVLEKERSESESNWSRKLKEKVKEVEELNRMLGTWAKSREENISIADKLRSDLAQSQEEIRLQRERVAELPVLQDRIQELEKTAKDQEQELRMKMNSIEKQVEEHKARESQLRQANKMLKEELRKVQSSAALLERQRNPGVGYWNRTGGENSSSADNGRQLSPSIESSSPGTSTPAPSLSTSSKEEEINLEYLRNVILQFLEHKEMRPNLVKVISIILQFTPQETRRLMAKV